MPHQKSVPERDQPDEPGQGDIAEQAQNHRDNRNDDLSDAAAGKDQAPGPGDGRGPKAAPTIIPSPD